MRKVTPWLGSTPWSGDYCSFFFHVLTGFLCQVLNTDLCSELYSRTKSSRRSASSAVRVSKYARNPRTCCRPFLVEIGQLTVRIKFSCWHRSIKGTICSKAFRVLTFSRTMFSPRLPSWSKRFPNSSVSRVKALFTRSRLDGSVDSTSTTGIGAVTMVGLSEESLSRETDRPGDRERVRMRVFPRSGPCAVVPATKEGSAEGKDGMRNWQGLAIIPLALGGVGTI